MGWDKTKIFEVAVGGDGRLRNATYANLAGEQPRDQPRAGPFVPTSLRLEGAREPAEELPNWKSHIALR